MQAGYGAAYTQDFESAGSFAKPSPFGVRRRPTNLASLLTSTFIPVMIFASVFSLMGFSMHYNSEGACKALCFAVLFIVVNLGVMAFGAWRKWKEGTQDPKWYTFLFVTGLIGWISGYVLGDSNFTNNIRPYMDIINLNIYPSIDPAAYRGQQLMDAGRIIFTEGTHLNLSVSMGFKNLDTYCVAPITSSAMANSTSFDFWAVGINCCSGHRPDFHCGEYNNVNARSGLRLMKDDQRAYFRLAVQQAEAAYNIRAPHPLFLYWMQDPMAEVNAYQDAGYKSWLVGIGAFTGFQIISVIVAAVVFSKFGF